MASLLSHLRHERAGPVRPSTDVPETSWRFLLLATAALMAVVAALNISFRAGRGFYTAVYADTGHLVSPALIAGLRCWWWSSSPPGTRDFDHAIWAGSGPG